jgi:hypothetical protein
VNRILVSFFAEALFVGMWLVGRCAAQSGPAHENPSDAQADASSQLQSGTTFEADLTKPIDARKNHVGDGVFAKVTGDAKSGGKTIVPEGSKLVGHVTEVKQRSKDQAASELRVVFDRAVLRNGAEMPLSLRIQAIGRPQTAPTGEDELASGTTNVSQGGLLGGLGSTTTGAASDIGGAAHSAGLAPTSHGVVGLRGLTLATQTSASATAEVSVISSSTGNVHLDVGTEMILRVNH